MGVSQNMDTFFGGPHGKDDNILKSILGSPYFGKLQYILPLLMLASLHLQGKGTLGRTVIQAADFLIGI